MPENQNIEYKSSWQDEYLKWICGFANANGGSIFIGKDDNGVVIGLKDSKKLLEDLPNKIISTMGITADVNLHEFQNMHFIEIVVSSYSVPISLRGRYYYRSGSTKQELTGTSLNEFLLKKSGRTWDDIIEPRASFQDIDENAVATFIRSSEASGRLPKNNGINIPELFHKLRLTENGQLKRAAIILFGKEPSKFFPNTFVKIGRFSKSDADLIFQETEEGNIIVLLESVLNQLNHKFLIRQIEFKGMNRIENFEYPITALREAILNALVHRNYLGSPIQIRVYENKISFWNEGLLPVGLTFESLKGFHVSRPRNALIADVCFKGAYIDSWGRGTLKIFDSCKEAKLPEPEIKEFQAGILVTLYKDNLNVEELMKIGLNERQINAVLFVKENGRITNKNYQEINNTSDRTALRDLDHLIELNILKKDGEKKATSYSLRFGG